MTCYWSHQSSSSSPKLYLYSDTLSENKCDEPESAQTINKVTKQQMVRLHKLLQSILLSFAL